IEGFPTFLRDARVRRRELSLHESLARREGLEATFRIANQRARGILLEADRAPGFGEPQAIAGRDTPAEPRPAPELRDLPRHEKAVLGIGDRALDEIAPGQAAEAAVDLAQTREHARRGDRSVPDIV